MSLHPIWIALDEFLAGELTVDELASRAADMADLDAVLGASNATELSRLAIEGPNAAQHAAALARHLYDRHRPGALARDRAARIAGGMVNGSINAAAGTRALARLSRDGHEWIPAAFESLADALDGVAPGQQRGWEPGALGARLTEERARARELRAPAIVAARRLLERLERTPDRS